MIISLRKTKLNLSLQVMTIFTSTEAQKHRSTEAQKH